MANENKTKDLTAHSRTLERILLNREYSEDGEKCAKSAGEFMETLRSENLETEELEALAVTLVAYENVWRTNSQFNDDYRSRILKWFMDQAGTSPVIRIACVNLSRHEYMLTGAAFGTPHDENALDQIKSEAAAELTAAGDPVKALIAWVAGVGQYTPLAELIEEFLSDKELATTHEWYLHLAAYAWAFRTKPSGAKKMFSAFYMLSRKNVTESVSAFKTASTVYGKLGTMALNLLFMEETSERTVRDNISKNILNAVAELKETDDFTALEARGVRSVLETQFSRKVDGDVSTAAYFKQRACFGSGSYQPIFTDDRKWKLLYWAVGNKLTFYNAGYLAFDPLDEGNRVKWDTLSKEHKLQLLDYACSKLYRYDLNEPYPDAWRESVRTAVRLFNEVGQAQKEPQDAYQVVMRNSLYGAINALIQAGLMEAPDTKARFWPAQCHTLMFQYMLQFREQFGKTPLWFKEKCDCLLGAQSTLQSLAELSCTAEEKGRILLAVLETVWENMAPEYYRVLMSLFSRHPDMLGLVLTKAELAELASTMLHCQNLSEQERETLLRYALGEDAWERRRHEMELQTEEQNKLEALRDFQDELANRLTEIVGIAMYSICSGIRGCKHQFVKPDLARIATQRIHESSKDPLDKLKNYIEIAQAADCDTYLYEEMEKMIQERKGEKAC